MMTGQELATSLAEGVGPIILLFNNAMYGTIRMHQERRFPGRVVGTALKNPDFIGLAAGLRRLCRGGDADRGIRPGLRGGGAARNTASIIEIRMDPDVITTRTTLSEIRRQALARQAEA